jgi:hypothetical protein
MRATITFGDVPTSVIKPPMSEPKASGIRSCDGEVPERLASWNATGMRIASAPTFLMKVDSRITARTRVKTCAWIEVR